MFWTASKPLAGADGGIAGGDEAAIAPGAPPLPASTLAPPACGTSSAARASVPTSVDVAFAGIRVVSGGGACSVRGALCVASGAAFRVTSGVAPCVASSAALGAVSGIALGVAPGAALGVVSGIAFSVTGGAALGVVSGVALCGASGFGDGGTGSVWRSKAAVVSAREPGCGGDCSAGP